MEGERAENRLTVGAGVAGWDPVSGGAGGFPHLSWNCRVGISCNLAAQAAQERGLGAPWWPSAALAGGVRRSPSAHTAPRRPGGGERGRHQREGSQPHCWGGIPAPGAVAVQLRQPLCASVSPLIK